MTKKLKVKVLKKSKNAPYPEHIIVERPSTHEMAHLYFNNGALAKFTHIVPNPQTNRVLNETERKDDVFMPSYIVHQEFTVKNGEPFYSKGPKRQNFFTIVDFMLGGLSSISFHNSPDEQQYDFVVDLWKNCDYHAQNNAEIKEIYPHLKRKIPASSLKIVKGNFQSK